MDNTSADLSQTEIANTSKNVRLTTIESASRPNPVHFEEHVSAVWGTSFEQNRKEAKYYENRSGHLNGTGDWVVILR